MTTTISLRLQGVNCGSCVRRAEQALASVDGIHSAQVNLANASADIQIEQSAATTIAELVQRATQALAQAGYPAQQQHWSLDIEGMHCASCVGQVERALKQVAGVTDAQVNLASERAEVTGYQQVVATADLLSAVKQVGYQARQRDANQHNDPQQQQAQQQRRLKRQFLIALLLTLPVFTVEMGGHLIPALHHWLYSVFDKTVIWTAQALLTTLVMVWPGRQFFSLGLPGLLRGHPDMNALVALGASAAWLFSMAVLVVPSAIPAQAQHVYFEAAAAIITLILLGRYLEARAKGRTGEAIENLLNLQAKQARVEDAQGQLKEVAIEQLQAGDIVLVKPGERIACDGEVLSGESYIDQAMLTGEPEPVKVGEGDKVVGGTINKQGSLRVRVTDVGEHSQLAQIIRLVEQAQGTRLPVQSLVNRVTAVFVPVVIGLATLTAVLWFWLGQDDSVTLGLINAVAVLVIACPCAMGLATPVSIMVGSGRAAQLSILFRQGDALQSLKDCQVVAFDKTGTLTEGKPTLQHISLFDNASFSSEETVLATVAALETQSEHPLAQAIVQAAQQRSVELPAVEQFQAHAGLGVSATVAGQPLWVGAKRFMQQQQINLDAADKALQRYTEAAASVIFVANQQGLVALLAVADQLRDSAKVAVDELHQQGKKVAMISGDNQATAEAIARQLHIDQVIADVMPDGKVEAIKQLRQQYGQVAFVGDGINDAPALAAADVGVAIGSGTDVAIESADVVLMNAQLTSVVKAFGISRATLRNIQQNLFWAFAYNASLMPIAAGVLYPWWGILLSPIFAAGAMAFSSIFVLLNALRLKRYGR
ncbi:heavy metal translocating P-type ATPase [Idiomarina xiamenensis]|uniref:heavy metal translocating P-type ATPase n=1 Tax=Idiomarina xiamenensis TaxID=1207041 RepID=UPI000688E887